MKILSAEKIREADAATIKNEPIASIDLMERASQQFTKAFTEIFRDKRPAVVIFAGPGNNGGDGLAVARMLLRQKYKVKVCVVSTSDKYSKDCQTNIKRLEKLTNIIYIKKTGDIPEISDKSIVVDALFGSGLSRPVEGLFATVIEKINASGATVVAVDMPSGLFSDRAVDAKSATIARAGYTFSFQLPKLAFLFRQNEQFVGKWQVLDIGLDQNFIAQAETDYQWVDEEMAAGLVKNRNKFSHKGDFGKVLLIAGSHGKMGAAVLGAQACLRTGAGLLTLHIPKKGYDIIQISLPEAMASVDKHADYFTKLKKKEVNLYDTIGVGPGIGQEKATKSALAKLLKNAKQFNKPMVLDADALNICSQDESLLKLLPADVILTPHPKEFERLGGKAKNDFHRLELARQFARKHKTHLVLKGAYSAIVTPKGKVYFNSTGNPGMATGGSGDVLTGILSALLAQGYAPLEASLLGVFLHGLAGDLAAKKQGQEALMASDITAAIPAAYQQLHTLNSRL